jgi:hypothetical protein
LKKNGSIEGATGVTLLKPKSRSKKSMHGLPPGEHKLPQANTEIFPLGCLKEPAVRSPFVQADQSSEFFF